LNHKTSIIEKIMNFPINFPLKLYEEGKITFYAPDLNAYRIPQDAPVFYNPKMEFNRPLGFYSYVGSQERNRVRQRTDPNFTIMDELPKWLSEFIGKRVRKI
jgi:hypothetical protein